MKNKWIVEHPEEWKEYQRLYRKNNPSMQKKANKKAYALHGKRWEEKARSKGQIQAKGKVALAIKKGLILCLKNNVIKCSDCPSRAVIYDHRDYNKPLIVEPVCTVCNVKRGPAIFLKEIV